MSHGLLPHLPSAARPFHACHTTLKPLRTTPCPAATAGGHGSWPFAGPLSSQLAPARQLRPPRCGPFRPLDCLFCPQAGCAISRYEPATAFILDGHPSADRQQAPHARSRPSAMLHSWLCSQQGPISLLFPQNLPASVSLCVVSIRVPPAAVLRCSYARMPQPSKSLRPIAFLDLSHPCLCKMPVRCGGD